MTSRSDEVWKDICGYEGLYQASSLGRIRAVDGKTTFTQRHGARKWKGRILKPKGQTYTTGYRVSLWKDGTQKDYLIARLVASTFISLPIDKETVNHKDGNRFNNEVGNLEWLTLADNIRHGFDNNLYPQKNTTLIKDGVTLHFTSMSKASLFLGRNKGYISMALNKGRNVCDKFGVAYTVVN